MTTQNDSYDILIAFRRVQQTVLAMLEIIENPTSTSEDRQRACSTIRDTFEIHETPDLYGVNVAECEIGAAAADPAVDRIASKLDSQEAAFWDRLQVLMKAKAMTQTQLASRVGSTQPAVSQMLKRKCRPQRSTILSLAEALEVDPRELWPELDVADILDTVAAVQEEQAISDAEADAIRRGLKRSATDAPASPLPRRKR
jgi:transcriptional regulator with XRE-family HTH domain